MVRDLVNLHVRIELVEHIGSVVKGAGPVTQKSPAAVAIGISYNLVCHPGWVSDFHLPIAPQKSGIVNTSPICSPGSEINDLI